MSSEVNNYKNSNCLLNSVHIVTLCCYCLIGMSAISSGSIHHEINDFDVKSICQYALSICGGQYSCAKYGKKLPQKAVSGSTTGYVRHICLFLSTLS